MTGTPALAARSATEPNHVFSSGSFSCVTTSATSARASTMAPRQAPPTSWYPSTTTTFMRRAGGPPAPLSPDLPGRSGAPLALGWERRGEVRARQAPPDEIARPSPHLRVDPRDVLAQKTEAHEQEADHREEDGEE